MNLSIKPKRNSFKTTQPSLHYQTTCVIIPNLFPISTTTFIFLSVDFHDLKILRNPNLPLKPNLTMSRTFPHRNHLKALKKRENNFLAKTLKLRREEY
jgi:hypothetical protein